MGKPTIYLRSTAAPFEQLGSGTLSGVRPENVQTQHGPNGAEQASFDLRRDPSVDWPDLVPFTPVVIYDEGLVSWTGRIQETPTMRGGVDDKLSVVCEGWQAHLSDDALQLRPVVNDLAAWKDARSVGSVGAAGVNLATWTGAYDVTVGDGLASISCTRGAAINTLGGIILDAGAGRTFAQLAVTWIGGGIANLDLRCAGGDILGTLTETSVLDATPIITTVASGTFTFATARRYVYIYAAATAAVAAADTGWVQILTAIAYSSSSYASGGASILKASTVIGLALPSAPLVNQSTTDISTTTFNLPTFDGPIATVRDYIEAPNAYHGYDWKLVDDPAGGAPRLRFRARPTVPILLARVGAGLEFADASRNDGGEIYNRCIVHYTDAAGNDAYADRTTALALGASGIYDVTSTVSAGTNPGFETAGGPPAAGWGIGLGIGNITRDVGVFDTGVASGLASSNGVNEINVYTTVTGLSAGRSYKVQYRVRANAAWLAGTVFAKAVDATITDPVFVGSSVTTTTDSFTNAIGAAFTTRSFQFTAPLARSVRLFWYGYAPGTVTAAANIMYLDNVTLLEAKPTIPDRQSFTRTFILETGSRLTAAAANQLGDAFLLVHQSSPFRGSIAIVGDALRDIASGQAIPVGLLGRYVGDPILITEGDPDTSAQGRVGIIAAVSVDHAANTAQLSIDSRRDYLDVLTQRFKLFQGGA